MKWKPCESQTFCANYNTPCKSQCARIGCNGRIGRNKKKLHKNCYKMRYDRCKIVVLMFSFYTTCFFRICNSQSRSTEGIQNLKSDTSKMSKRFLVRKAVFCTLTLRSSDCRITALHGSRVNLILRGTPPKHRFQGCFHPELPRITSCFAN